MSVAPEQGAGQADRHLGESLAALIDGELSHDSRDRVLAHLATCADCKAEADAQRRLKSVFAESPLPTLSSGLLARLQDLPAAGGAPPGPPSAPTAPRPGPFGLGRGSALPGGAERESLLSRSGLGPDRGFRIHRIQEPARPSRESRPGHRFAFAAAGAVSVAAFAIAGAVSTAGLGTPPTAGSPGPANPAAAGSTAASMAGNRTTGRVEETATDPAAETPGLRPVGAMGQGFSGALGPVALSGQQYPLPLWNTEPIIWPLTASPGPSPTTALGAVSPR
ncbi:MULTISPECIES: anti-sigma factor family protein [Streptomyces]|uniref:Putative zinc-finger n=2 Tax=Streptomyces TaxID=1883 RepID=A0A1I6U0V5_9ACTN|nr:MULTISPECIES: anti-sigma factor [Streptomyces]QKV70532.1 zf-HC2 domain-containing protein [Streptomyces harbinensis]SFS95052.1 Putative zinc-finger [Streptomyces harbinensis]